MKAVILAGGKGTRLGDLAKDLPKPMVTIGDASVLEHQLRLLAHHGVREVVLSTGFGSEKIEKHFGDGTAFGVRLSYAVDTKPQGTAGAVREIKDRLSGDFLLLYGDVMVDMDLTRLMEFHRAKRSEATLVVHPNSHPVDSDLLETDGEGRVTRFLPKPHAPGLNFRNLVSAGLYVLSDRIFAALPVQGFADFGKDVFPKMLGKAALFGYRTPEYLKDMGTPGRLREVREDFESGRIQRRSLSNKRAAVFVDRDGVINEDVQPVTTPSSFRLLDGVTEAFRLLNQSDYLAVVVTNQPGIAKGQLSEAELEETHKRMETLLGLEGAWLDAAYHCPHHPDAGFAGERKDLKIDCTCRKPKPGMLNRAARDLNADLKRSFLIGDAKRDILCGKAVGARTIGVRTGNGCRDIEEAQDRPDRMAPGLLEAVNVILKEEI